MAPKNDPSAELSQRLVIALESQRALGQNCYPLTLARLVQLADPIASPQSIDKAISKKPFKERALVAQKKNHAAPVALAEDLQQLAASPLLLQFALASVCTADQPLATIGALKAKVDKSLKKPFEEAVTAALRQRTLPTNVGYRLEKNKPLLYLTRLPPPPLPPPPRKPEEVLAAKLLDLLENQRQLGPENYPLALKSLVALADARAKAALIKKALAHPTLSGKLVVVDAKNLDAPIAFAEDRGRLLSSAQAFEFLLRAKRKTNANAFAVESLLSKKSSFYRDFVESASRQIDEGKLPSTIGWMWIGKKKQVFFLDDVRGHHPMPTRDTAATPRAPAASGTPVDFDFASSFDDAFGEIDRQKGSHNFVNLVDLRRRLPVVREVFDSGLRNLRLAGKYTLSAAEGRHGITPEEREAAVVENGSTLLFVSKRTP
jgi:hypothetical protein